MAPLAISTGKTILQSGARRFLVALIFANLFVIGLISLALYQGFLTHRQMAAVDAENLSRVLEEDLSRFIDKVDLTLLAVIDEIDRQKAAGGIDAATLDQFIARHDARIPEALGIRVLDENGIVTHAVTNVIAKNADMSGTGTFVHSKSNADGALFISTPIASPISGKAALGLAHRLDNADGSFAGQVHAGVAVEQLAKLFSTIDLGAGGSVTLTDAQARVIARYPNPLGDKAVGGTPTVLPTLHALIDGGSKAAGYHTRSAVDGISRTYFFREVDVRPLYLLVGMADDDTLSIWRREALVMGALLGLFLLISAAAATRLTRDWKTLLDTTQELSRKEASLALFRQAIDRSNDAILIIDIKDGGLFDFNQAACEQLGYSSDELSCLCVLDIDPNLADLAAWTALSATLVEGDGGLMFPRVHRRKDGSTFPVEISWRAVTVDGHKLGISVERDATEKIRVEQDMLAKATELQQANAALTQSNADLERFAYVASHDLQTPLRNIVSFSQLLERRQQGRLDGESQEFLQFIVDSAKRMSLLISDLLQFARITSQGNPLTAVPAQVALDFALANLRGVIADTGAIITIGNLPEVMADEPQLTSLFQNLVGNALKYRHPERKPQIDISAQPFSASQWRLSVRDNGIGIEPAYHQKIFEIFQRLNPASDVQGTGVGLTVCQRIARRFGGDIWVESPPGEGSIFHVTIGRVRQAPGQ
ncbi:MAG TPA: ATP-binding protein [Patescibacteria group bacterium]|nr:ATP-binding protein [Patescibacteria group bacterium]